MDIDAAEASDSAQDPPEASVPPEDPDAETADPEVGHKTSNTHLFMTSRLKIQCLWPIPQLFQSTV